MILAPGEGAVRKVILFIFAFVDKWIDKNRFDIITRVFT